MGRSVSYPSNNCAVEFTHLEAVYCCSECGEIANDYDEPSCECEGADIVIDHDACQHDWQDFCDGVRSVIKDALPDFDDCGDKWLGREDLAILESYYHYVGVSEYCGLVAVWAVPKVDDYYMDLRERAKVAAERAKLPELIAKAIGGSGLDRLRKVATFSNGEAVYRRVAA